jgi:hypothetical protein
MFNKKLVNLLKTSFAVGFLLLAPSLYGHCHKSSHSHHHHSECSKEDCGAEVLEQLSESETYKELFHVLNRNRTKFTDLLHNVTNQASYQVLYDAALELAAKLNVATGLTGGRVVVTDPDGLVVVDTAKGALNTYANFQAGANPATFAQTINVNHNSRVSILDAQQWPCGVGVETKFSNSVQTFQNYVAVRLGPYLNNSGTYRGSVNAS